MRRREVVILRWGVREGRRTRRGEVVILRWGVRENGRQLINHLPMGCDFGDEEFVATLAPAHPPLPPHWLVEQTERHSFHLVDGVTFIYWSREGRLIGFLLIPKGGERFGLLL